MAHPLLDFGERTLMRLAWICVVAGLPLAVASFFPTAHAPTINP